MKRSILTFLVGSICLLLLWHVVARWMANPFTLPSPQAVASATYIHSHYLFISCLQTLSAAGIAFLLSALFGGLLCTSVVIIPSIRPVLTPYLQVFRASPIIVVCLLIHSYTGGRSFYTAIVVSAIVGLFPVAMMGIRGADQTPSEQIDAALSFGLSECQCALVIRVPWMLYGVLDGLRMSASLCLVGVVVVELVYPDRGIGLVVSTALQSVDLAAAVSAVLTISIAGFIWTYLVEALMILLHNHYFGRG